jgi:hypothetical protein
MDYAISNEQARQEAFERFRQNYGKHSPALPLYEIEDIRKAFEAGYDSRPYVVWHDGSEEPMPGKSILAYNLLSDCCETMYGGGSVSGCYWAYLEDIFNDVMMDEVRERECERRSLMEEDPWNMSGYLLSLP